MSDTGPGVLVPVNQLDRSKTRLASVLNQDQRRELTRRLFEYVLDVLTELPSTYDRAVISRDDRVRSRLRSTPVTYLPEPRDLETLGEVVDHGAGQDWYQSERGLLVIPLDLPLLTADRLREYLEYCRSRPVVLNPDSAERGTNALWRQPASRFACQYRGTESFRAHRRVSRESGIEPQVTREPRIGFDLDTPADLLALYRSTHTLSPEIRHFLVRFRDRFTWRTSSC